MHAKYFRTSILPTYYAEIEREQDSLAVVSLSALRSHGGDFTSAG